MGAFVVVAFSISGCTHGRRTPSARSSPPGATTTVPALTADEATALGESLTAGTTSGLGVAIAVPTGPTIDPHAAAALESLGPITFDVSTFRPIGADDATVQATVAHPPSGFGPRWTFLLSYVSGHWLVDDASPAS